MARLPDANACPIKEVVTTTASDGYEKDRPQLGTIQVTMVTKVVFVYYLCTNCVSYCIKIS